jgi:methionyl-tRNA formyltransferase
VTRAVVFAYHDVGVRCLRVLLAHGIEVALVLTHEDNPQEHIWFDSVARHARWHGLELITPADPNTPEIIARVRAARADFLFSFYYRNLLGPELLACASHGAYNMHGSLLPQYRGRVPVNWAVLRGERTTGATLHAMTIKPDAGALVDAEAVPILPDDTALEVFRKVTVAAEITLDRALPGLVAGTAQLKPQDLSQGGYFGRRTARDGAIDWHQGIRAVHNLVRAVAPPFPGAFARADGEALRVLRTLPVAGPGVPEPQLLWREGAVLAMCPDGALKLLEFELASGVRDAAGFRARYGTRSLALANGTIE